MTVKPDRLMELKKRDLKLGIKSSLPKAKSVLALFILFALCNSKSKSELFYSKAVGSKIEVDDDLLTDFTNKYSRLLNSANIKSTIDENNLFKSQMESLLVAFELIWTLAKVNFVDASKTFSSERTGSCRYPKFFNYTANLDLLRVLVESDFDKYSAVLLKWANFTIIADNDAELRLEEVLLVLSEQAVYKLSDSGKSVVFNLGSVYRKVLESSMVNIDDEVEAKGSLRILKEVLDDDINPYLSYSNGNVSATTFGNNELKSYCERVEMLHMLLARENPQSAMHDDTLVIYLSGFSNVINGKIVGRNRIIFGAPGTGKSNSLNEDKKMLLEHGGEFERVTFHPDYSYAQFVGTYKPVSYDDEDGNKKIKYEFVPGPFTRILIKALRNGMDANGDSTKAKPYLLIIEELNRAKTAAVFGDVFQLLDRGDDGVSEYDIQTSEDLRKYLAQELGVSEDAVASIKIPDNMFIWATMNSADQGVFPLDTAFKRRWNFEYIGVDGRDGDHNDLSFKVKHDAGKDKQEETIYWDELRKAINNHLSSDTMKVHEDKLLGPFFIKGKDGDDEKNIAMFCDKVLMYLFDDVVKVGRDRLFQTGQCNRFSEVRNDFLKRGTKIFVKEVLNEYDELVKSRPKEKDKKEAKDNKIAETTDEA